MVLGDLGRATDLVKNLYLYANTVHPHTVPM